MTPAEIFEAAQDAFEERVLNVPAARALAIAKKLRAISVELEWLAGASAIQFFERESDLPMKIIVETVCVECNVTPLELRGRGKAQRLANARHLAVYLAREITDLSFPIIGDYFMRDHATIMHSHGVIQKRYKAEPEFMRYIRRLSAGIIATVNAQRAIKQPALFSSDISASQLSEVAA